MSNLLIKKGYESKLNIVDTEIAVKKLKDYFQSALSKALQLTRVSAPLFVFPETGLNDNLNGVERPVSFDMKEQGSKECQIVQSLAKWKRNALKKYGFTSGNGLYTDMNAIRRDEETDNIHSIYVDQWDWERILEKSDRNIAFLKSIVTKIYQACLDTEAFINAEYPMFTKKLPETIHFITSQELLDLYPGMTTKQREDAYLKENKAAFIMQIGGELSDGSKHDGRAPDYDDWSLNGDIMLFNPVLDAAFEISSMGIRVDEKTLLAQLEIAGCNDRLAFPFHDDIINGRLPYTIGGGIGQSRLCMFFLEKLHIGEVQASVWKESDLKICAENGINLL